MSDNGGLHGHDEVIAVPISLKTHFEQLGEDPGQGRARVVYFDPGDPGHDFLNPDTGSGKKGVLARISAALRPGGARP